MIALDTDHISVLQHDGSPAATELQQKLDACVEQIATTAATLEEQSRSWISVIGRESDVERQVIWYERLVGMFEFFAEWDVLPFNEDAAKEFKRLRHQRIRIGPTDLKIAAIALVHDATLLSANQRDFEQVPNLKLENWLES